MRKNEWIFFYIIISTSDLSRAYGYGRYHNHGLHYLGKREAEAEAAPKAEAAPEADAYYGHYYNRGYYGGYYGYPRYYGYVHYG